MDTSAEQKTCDVCYCICCKKTFKQRNVLLALLFICPIFMYMQRVCLSLAIVNMTFRTEPEHHDRICIKNFNDTSEHYVHIVDEQYDWDETIQGYLLLSFFFGYMIGSLFVGFVINRWGGRITMLIGITVASTLTMVLPMFAYYTHWGCIFAARVMCGVGQSTTFSSSTTLIARWHTEKTKSSASTLVLSSFNIGIILGNVGTGFIMEWTRTWCWVFYIEGGLGVIWVVFFFFYVYSSPDTHPHVTKEEKDFLADIPKPKTSAVPICTILGDLPVWMFFLAFFASDFTVYLIVVNIPKYFVQVLGLTTPVTGMILMAPPAAGAVGGLTIAHIGDCLISKKLMRKLVFRTICTVVGLVLPPILVLAMVFMECNVFLASIMVTISMFCQSWYYAGAGMMACDMSLNYTGLLYGYCNVAGGLSGVISPYIVSQIAYDSKFPQWKIVGTIITGISVVAAIPILMFTKVERRYWDYASDETQPPPDDAPVRKRIWSCYKAV